MQTGGVVVLVIVILLLAVAAGWVVFARIRAQRLGLPPPAWASFIPFRDSSRGATFGVQPAPGGISNWFSDRIQGFKNRNNRTAVGAYEGAGAGGSGRGARRGFGPLDPDEAWDARVGAEADAFYYSEEQELGLHPGANAGAAHHGSSRLNVSNSDTSYLGSGAYGGSSYDMNVPVDAIVSPSPHDEPRGRSRDRSPNTNTTARGLNPFDDDAGASNMSLRGVSPRPIADTGAPAHDAHKADSPTERRSMFRENV